MMTPDAAWEARLATLWASLDELDADEFVEGIVDDEARNYTKRVLGSFFTYSWLYEGTVPDVPNKIPAELLPKK